MNMQMNQKDEGIHHPIHRRIPRLASNTESKHSKARRGKKKATKIIDNQKELPELASELLELIAKRLDVVGFCAFGAVCKDWWKIYAKSKEDFLESQAPMAVLISAYAKRACYLYDMANANTKKVMLPNLIGKVVVGCSAGYMVIEDMNYKISFINPLTGNGLNVQTPPFALRGKYIHDLIILIPDLSSRSYIILTIASNKHEIRIFHSRRWRWFTTLNIEQCWADIAIFLGKAYIITRKARFGDLTIKGSHFEISWLEVRNTPVVDSGNLKLVVSNNQLLMVDFVPKEYLNIFKMDFDSMEWVRLDNLGDQALFLSGKWGSTIRKPCKWEGQSNCVYYLSTLSTTCCIYSMEAKLMNKISLVENSATSKMYSYGWYYPHQCMKLDYLVND